MTDKQLTKLKESLFKQENEVYKTIRWITKLYGEFPNLYHVQAELERANKVAENLKKLREQLPVPKKESTI